MEGIRTLIRVMEIKTKPKDKIELAANLTKYYFNHLYSYKDSEDRELLQKKMELFCVYVLDFLLHPKKRFKVKKVFREIDKTLRRWKLKKFKEWRFTTKGITFKDICLKKQSLDLSCFSFIF